MEYKLRLPMKLRSMNEYITACRKNPQEGARMKRIDQKAVEWCITNQLRGIRLKKPVSMVYRWYEPNRKRDKDNISSYGRKVIQDGLVNCHVIQNDGWNCITGFSDEFYVDKKSPRIEVILKTDD